MDPKPPMSEIDRFLRKTTILAFIPAFSLLLPYGISSGGHNGALVAPLLLIPMGFSAVLGLVDLSYNVRSKAIKFCLDAFIAAFLFSLLVPTWVLMADSWWSGARETMLGSYGTTPAMVTFCIHLYFLGIRLPHFSFSKTCPHCSGDLKVGNFVKVERSDFASDFASSSKQKQKQKQTDAYHPLNQAYNDIEEVDDFPRASVDTQDNDFPRASVDTQDTMIVTSGFPTPRQSADTLNENDTGKLV